jgi:hypothetical protein
MRRRWKAVQEQNGGSIPGTGFAIEDFQPLHVKRAIENGRRNRFGLGRHKCLLEKVRDKRLELKEFCWGVADRRESSRHSAKVGQKFTFFYAVEVVRSVFFFSSSLLELVP